MGLEESKTCMREDASCLCLADPIGVGEGEWYDYKGILDSTFSWEEPKSHIAKGIDTQRGEELGPF